MSAEERLPWVGRPSRADILCWAGISLSGFYALAMLPVKPSLIGTHPVLLELLTGSTAATIAAAASARVGDTSLVLVILAAIPGLILFDPLYWWAGRRWGRRAVDVFTGRGPRAQRWADRGERLARRYGWLAVVLAYYLPVPNVIVYAVVGWTGMGLARFVALDVLAALLLIGRNVGLGWALGQPAVDVADAISHYALYVTIGLVVAIIAAQAWRSRRSRPQAA
jgi:membrane protein DedA with SNARE-associated domain